MKSFREILNESPVGKVGRTSGLEAAQHIESNDLEKKFIKIVKELGGKTAARLLLARMNQKGEVRQPSDISEASQSPISYIRDSGYKIKFEEPIKNGKEIEFYKKSAAQEALEDLKSAGYNKIYSLDLANTILTITKL